MTNEERADKLKEEIFIHFGMSDGGPSPCEVVDWIERALDEAEKRGYRIGFNEADSAKHDLKDIHNAFVRGQKEMRERAASESQKAEFDCCGLCAKLIRALPIEGEIRCQCVNPRNHTVGCPKAGL